MGKKEIIGAVKIAALLICLVMTFLGGSRFVVYLGFMGVIVFCLYVSYEALCRSAARSAKGAELKRRAMDDLHRIAEVLGCAE